MSSLGGIGGTGLHAHHQCPGGGDPRSPARRPGPVWNGKEFVPRLILPLCLSSGPPCHRDGAMAACFLVHLAQVLADFRRISPTKG